MNFQFYFCAFNILPLLCGYGNEYAYKYKITTGTSNFLPNQSTS